MSTERLWKALKRTSGALKGHIKELYNISEGFTAPWLGGCGAVFFLNLFVTFYIMPSNIFM